MTETTGQQVGGISASSIAAAAPADSSASRLGRLATATLLYAIGTPFLIVGLAVVADRPYIGLGMIGAAAMIIPFIRHFAYRFTGLALPTALRVILAISLVLVPTIVESVQTVMVEHQAERQKLASELGARKPELLKRLRFLIDNKDYQAVVNEAKRFALVSDPDITALIVQAKDALEAEKAEQAAIAQRAEQKRCNADDACFSKDYEREARRQCKPLIEASARYDHEWTDGFAGPSTFLSASVDRDAGTIRFAGNQLKLQNGFGTWQQYRYECLFDYRRNKVVTAEVNG